MNDDLVSVIMSTYQTPEEYLRIAVESILNQSYRNIELIVVIDGICSNNEKVLASFADARLKIIRHDKTIGLAGSLNEAIILAKGKYIARMDSDDYSLPNRIFEQYRYMKKHSDIDICSSFARDFGASTKIRVQPFLCDEYVKAKLFLGNVLVHSTVMFRSEVFKEKQIQYDKDYMRSQDYELWTRAKKKCRFGILPKVLLLYRIHTKQASCAKKDEQMKYRDVVIDRNLKELFGSDVDDNYLRYVRELNCEESIRDRESLLRFVDNCISRNREKMIYSNRWFERVMYEGLLVSLIRNHFVVFILTRFFGLVHIFNLIWIIRKKYFLFVCSLKKETLKDNMKANAGA